MTNDQDRGKGRAELVKRRREASIVGWNGVCDQDGKPVAFTHQRLLSLTLRVSEIELAVINLLASLYEVVPIDLRDTAASE